MFVGQLDRSLDLCEDDAAVEGSSAQIRDLLTMSPTSKLDYVSSMQASYVPPRGPGGRQRGSRAEFLEKVLRQKISEKVMAEFGPAPPHKPDYISTSQRDFCVEGFVPAVPETTGHDYKTDQAVSFWRENNRRIQGMTATGALDSPFKKSSLFSTPITQRLDEPALPPDTS